MSQHDIARGHGDLFADEGADGFLHRAFLRGEGYDAAAVRRRPVIGICSSWSELSPCNNGLREVAQAVKRGVWDAGGIGLEFPTISLSEPMIRPTSMLLRNLMSMDVEEMISASPIDGVVLLAGCDKTVPAQLMGAASADLPALMVTAGPRAVSCWKGQATTIDEVWPAIEARRLGRVDDDDWLALEGRLIPGAGTCNVLGTAITMAAVAEVLGLALPATALVPAGSPEHAANAERAGKQIVAAVERGIRPTDLITRASLENAVRMTSALGGSTNAIIHLVAIAGRVGIDLDVETLRGWLSAAPLLADVRPTGRALLSELHAAGGVPAVARALRADFDGDTSTASGATWAEVIATVASPGPSDVIADHADPLAAQGLVILSGSLAPGGAVVKATGGGGIRHHRGRAIVFDGLDDMHARIDDPQLDVTEDNVLVLRGVGTRGAPGIPEVGHIPIPAKLARAGVADMVRITDARMSGTATGTVILHVTPEAAVGGPLAAVRDGDVIELDIAAGTIELLVPAEELGARETTSAPASAQRGYTWLYDRHVLQPDAGCDFDFLRASFREETTA